MKSSVKKTALILTASAVACFTLIGDAAADKKEQTYVKSNYRTVATSVLTVDQASKHVITQDVVLSDIKVSNPAFQIKDELTYGQSDTIDGSGTSRGYFIDTHDDGSRTYGTYQGTIKKSSKPDGSWEVVSEGTYQYVGGSGKYQNIKGSGTYKSKSSSQHPDEREEGRETVEY